MCSLSCFFFVGELCCENTDSWRRHVDLVIHVVCVFAVGFRHLELVVRGDFLMHSYPTLFSRPLDICLLIPQFVRLWTSCMVLGVQC